MTHNTQGNVDEKGVHGPTLHYQFLFATAWFFFTQPLTFHPPRSCTHCAYKQATTTTSRGWVLWVVSFWLDLVRVHIRHVHTALWFVCRAGREESETPYHPFKGVDPAPVPNPIRHTYPGSNSCTHLACCVLISFPPFSLVSNIRI